MARKKRRSSMVRRLHRSLGAFAAAFVIFMVISGLTINHANDLGLEQHHVSQPLLLDWYGLGEPQQLVSFALGNHWLSFAGSQLYPNDKPVATIVGGVGAVATNHMLIAAGRDELLLLGPAGELIERSAWSTPTGSAIDSIGLLNGTIVAVKSNDQVWLADADLLNWQVREDSAVDPAWSISATPPDGIHTAITQQYRGNGPSFERLLLDLHSGRFFGPIGVFIYDLLALAVGFLAVSGLILWFRSRRNGSRK